MCLKGSQKTVIVPGTVSVTPDNSLFWFGRPKFLLHLIQFVLVQVSTLIFGSRLYKIFAYMTTMIYIVLQNTFHLAYFTWSWVSIIFKSLQYNQEREINTCLQYSFGFHSCFHKNNGDIARIIVIGLLVLFLCAYVTLPLYALVAQVTYSESQTYMHTYVHKHT